MKIALITGSRADRAALEMVRSALGAPVHWIDLDGPTWAGWHPIHRTKLAYDHVWLELWRPDEPQFDLVVLHGDRHEILGAAMAANIMGVPIAHLGGGDLTEGSQDDCFRHAITKLSHLHFPSNADAGIRIEQMGEDPARVHVVGCPGIDLLMRTPLMGRDEAFAAVGLKSCERCLLVLFHPNTLGDTAAELQALSEALQARPAGTAMVLIGPNADAGSDLIRAEWKRLAALSGKRWDNMMAGYSPSAEYPPIPYHDNLARPLFLSLLKHCDALVGNSSAGFYEAPCFGTAVINIGDRQQGRPKPSNVTTVRAEAAEILKGIKGALAFAGFGKHLMVKNPYGDGHAAERIASVISSIGDPKALLRKRFVEREMARELIHAIGTS